MNETREEKQVYEYSLYVSGLFGRNRTNKGKSFSIASSDVELTPEDLEAKLESLIPTIKIKSARCKVSVNSVKLTYDEMDGQRYVTRTYMLFGATTLKLFDIPTN